MPTLELLQRAGAWPGVVGLSRAATEITFGTARVEGMWACMSELMPSLPAEAMTRIPRAFRACTVTCEMSFVHALRSLLEV